MPSGLNDLHTQVNNKQGYQSVKNTKDNSISVYHNNAVSHPRVVYEQSTDRVWIFDGGGVTVGSATAWLNSLK
jgi:hypothetical protein